MQQSELGRWTDVLEVLAHHLTSPAAFKEFTDYISDEVSECEGTRRLFVLQTSKFKLSERGNFSHQTEVQGVIDPLTALQASQFPRLPVLPLVFIAAV